MLFTTFGRKKKQSVRNTSTEDGNGEKNMIKWPVVMRKDLKDHKDGFLHGIIVIYRKYSDNYRMYTDKDGKIGSGKVTRYNNEYYKNNMPHDHYDPLEEIKMAKNAGYKFVHYKGNLDDLL